MLVNVISHCFWRHTCLISDLKDEILQVITIRITRITSELQVGRQPSFASLNIGSCISWTIIQVTSMASIIPSDDARRGQSGE